MSKQPPPAPTASAVGPCPTIIKIVGRPGTGSLPSTFAPPDRPFSNGRIVKLCKRAARLASEDIILKVVESLALNGSGC